MGRWDWMSDSRMARRSEGVRSVGVCSVRGMSRAVSSSFSVDASDGDMTDSVRTVSACCLEQRQAFSARHVRRP
jgi:hypothetical protein